jgi:hypothetical protein
MRPLQRVLAVAMASTALLTIAGPAQDAGATSTVRLDEVGSLRLTGKHGFTLYERGAASGTVTGTLYVRLTIVSTSRVTAELRLYKAGGAIFGTGSAAYRRGTRSATFAGEISIDRGSGVYAHASGARLSFDGAIRRGNDAISVHVSGTVRV